MDETVSGGIQTISPTTTSPPDKVEALRRVHVFADLTDDQLKWFADNSEDRRFAAGEVMFRKGDKPEAMVVYLEGRNTRLLGREPITTLFTSRAPASRQLK